MAYLKTNHGLEIRVQKILDIAMQASRKIVKILWQN
jgi:hypothetical protein